MAKKVIRYIDLQKTDSVDNLPFFKKLLAILLSLNKNKQKEAEARQIRIKEENRVRKIITLDNFLQRTIKNMKESEVIVQIDRRLVSSLEDVIGKSHYNLYDIEVLDGYSFKGIQSNIVLRIRRVYE